MLNAQLAASMAKLKLNFLPITLIGSMSPWGGWVLPERTLGTVRCHILK